MFFAPAGAFVEIDAAAGADTLTVFSAEEFRLHIKDKTGGDDIIQIYPVIVEDEELRIIGTLFLCNDSFELRCLDAFEFLSAAVTDAEKICLCLTS